MKLINLVENIKGCISKGSTLNQQTLIINLINAPYWHGSSSKFAIGKVISAER